MPNAKTHDKIGKAFGTGAAQAKAVHDKLSPFEILLESIGGYYGGALGAKIPDLVDPSSVGPRHRGMCHGLTQNYYLVKFGYNRGSRFQADLRKNGRELFSQVLGKENTLEGFLRTVGGMAMLILSGAMIGGVAGYASHLIADAGSPEGLPLLLGHDFSRSIL
jgi:hypothetical protein